MKRSTLLLLILPLLLLFLVGTAFSVLDFRLQREELTVNRTASTYAFGDNPQGMGAQVQALDLYVRAPAVIKGKLIQALRDELATNPYVGQIDLRETPPVTAMDSVLVLSLEDTQTLSWTPVYARTALNVDVAYASDGEVDWIGDQVVTLKAQESPAARIVRVRGEYTFDGTAYGLISRPGYYNHLAGEVAQTVNEALADTLADQHGALSQK